MFTIGRVVRASRRALRSSSAQTPAIWGAAAEGHEHDRADYEIFVWRVGTPWEGATRLTYHTGNDQWPDLWVRPPR